MLRDYPSFDLLWYDLEGSLRVMVQDLVEPSIRRMTEYDSKIERIRFEIPKCNARIDELKKIVMETDQKLDVFEKIHLRLAELNAERKILEDHVNYEVKTLKTRMTQMDEQREMDQKVFKRMQESADEQWKELVHLKEHY